jgi:hypothetical protein
MASALRKMTSVGADVRQIAALLQAKAPKGHMLAYITPQEAALLKAEGGSGKPQEDTGIPSFQPLDMTEQDMGAGQQTEESYSGPSSEAETVGSEAIFSDPISYSPPPGKLVSDAYSLPVPGGGERLRVGGAEGFRAAPEAIATPTLTAGGPRPEYDITNRMDATGAIQDAAKAPEGYADKLSKALGISKGDLAKLGITGVQAVLGGKQATQAREAGQAGKQEIQAVAAPYQAKGQELQAAAQRGELTPTGQQAIAAARAQAAQGAERRGGVGAQQMEAQVQALRNQLLQQQYDYGLKLSGIGDQMALGAIRTGMQADQYANQLTSSYFNNIARIAAGTPTAATPGAT